MLDFQTMTDTYNNQEKQLVEEQAPINKWDKSVPVEENPYYWKGDPIRGFLSHNSSHLPCSNAGCHIHSQYHALHINRDVHGKHHRKSPFHLLLEELQLLFCDFKERIVNRDKIDSVNDLSRIERILALVERLQVGLLPFLPLGKGRSWFALIMPIMIACRISPIQPRSIQHGFEMLYRSQRGEVDNVASQYDQRSLFLFCFIQRTQKSPFPPIAFAIILRLNSSSTHPSGVIIELTSPFILNSKMRVSQEHYRKSLLHASQIIIHIAVLNRNALQLRTTHFTLSACQKASHKRENTHQCSFYNFLFYV